MPATLEEIRTAHVELRTRLEGAGEKLNGLAGIAAADRGDNWIVDLRSTRQEVQILDDLHRVNGALWEDEERSAAIAAAASHGPRGATGSGATERRSLGEHFTVDATVSEWMTRGAHGNSPAIEIERRALLTTGTAANDAGALLPLGSPFISPGGLSRRRLFIRDVLSPGQTTLTSVPYTREFTPRTFETGATAQTEGSAKAEVTIKFVRADAPVVTIAGWVHATNQVLRDAATLASYINTRLPYMVMLAEERAILNGTGAPTLSGILTMAGVQAQAFSSSLAATLGLAVGKIETIDGEADAIAINPIDFWQMVTLRSSSRFDGEAVGASTSDGSPWGAAPMTVWGYPAIRSNSIASGAPVVGAWAMGAQIFDSETLTVRTSENYNDDFVKNQSVILAEERIALAVHRPDYFVVCATV